MDSKEQELRDRIAAASPDGYIDHNEEREMAQWAATNGLGQKFDTIMIEECMKNGIVRETTVKGQISSYLDNAFHGQPPNSKQYVMLLSYAKSLIPANNRNQEQSWAQLKGLLPPQRSGSSSSGLIVKIVFIIIVMAGGIFFGTMAYFRTSAPAPDVHRSSPVQVTSESKKTLLPADQEEINNLIGAMKTHVESGQYTYPPENCAKMDLDTIRRLDPAGTYRREDIEAQLSTIVDKYLDMARADLKKGNPTSAKKWIGRAKIFFRESEKIGDFEQEMGLKGEQEK
jgi:hypothetical protein